MPITEKRIYISDTLPEAPERLTLAEAEADEARGVELAAYLALLPTLTKEQWATARAVAWGPDRGATWDASCAAACDAARGAARGAAWDAARGTACDAARGAARGAAWGAAWGAAAIVARDLITPEQFNILTAPMRAAGIDFDNLTGGDAQ